MWFAPKTRIFVPKIIFCPTDPKIQFPGIILGVVVILYPIASGPGLKSASLGRLLNPGPGSQTGFGSRDLDLGLLGGSRRVPKFSIKVLDSVNLDLS